MGKSKIPGLHRALRGELYNRASFLISQGEDLRIPDRFGFYPLHYACKNGRIDLVKKLLEQKVDVNVTDHNNQTPLHGASIHGHDDIAELLLQNGANVNARDNNLDTPLHSAAINGRISVIKVLINSFAELNAVDKKGHMPIHKVSNCGDVNSLKLLLASGASINSLDISGQNSKELAKKKGSIQIVVFIEKFEKILQYSANFFKSEEANETKFEFSYLKYFRLYEMQKDNLGLNEQQKKVVDAAISAQKLLVAEKVFQTESIFNSTDSVLCRLSPELLMLVFANIQLGTLLTVFKIPGMIPEHELTGENSGIIGEEGE